MANEDTVLEEAMGYLKEAGQRIRATQSLMRSQGMADGENYRDLLTRLSMALLSSSSWRARATCMAEESRSQRRVEPSMSVNRKVTVPVGRLLTRFASSSFL